MNRVMTTSARERRIKSLCANLERHLIVDKEGISNTKALVEEIGNIKSNNGDYEEDYDYDEEDGYDDYETMKICLRENNCESLLQKMMLKLTRCGEDELAGNVGDSISKLYRIGKAKAKTKKKREKDVVVNESDDDDDDDDDDDADGAEDVLELTAVACSQVGADATQRPAGVQMFTMKKHKGVELAVYESSWQDAGLAWRIWGSARIFFKVVDLLAFEFFEDKTILEVGAGCGLIGSSIARLGGQVIISEGAPGALAAMNKTANGVNEQLLTIIKDDDLNYSSKKKQKGYCKVAFLDWRDDLQALAEEENGVVINLNAQQQQTKTCTTTNFVHMNKTSFEKENFKIADDAKFDCLVGSDLIYDFGHCTALAATVFRRLKPDHGRAIFIFAVRKQALIETFCKKCRKLGLLVHVYVSRIEPSKGGEDEPLSTTVGGHANRVLPSVAEDYWSEIADDFAEILRRDESIHNSTKTSFEGRFAMLQIVRASTSTANGVAQTNRNLSKIHRSPSSEDINIPLKGIDTTERGEKSMRVYK